MLNSKYIKQPVVMQLTFEIKLQKENFFEKHDHFFQVVTRSFLTPAKIGICIRMPRLKY